MIELEKRENILDIYRLRLVTNEEMLKNFSDNDVEFDPDEY
jgi:hypothetical protein